MPYKNRDAQRAYQREWIAQRRKEWFGDKVCVRCGSGKNLELDHKDRYKKVSHNIWSWSVIRRSEELAKCQVLCGDCHKAKTATEAVRGEENGRAKLTATDVLEMRQRHALGVQTLDEIGRPYGLDRRYVTSMVNRKYWKHI